jgi:antibiotic biosynthesis monooxygenase (ABM) superfamily enzyme
MRGTYLGAINRDVSSQRKGERPVPPRYKIFLLTWLAIYPLITLIFWVFGPWLSALPLLLRTFLLTGVLVYLMTYLVMPKLMKVFQGWLYLK